MGTLKKKFLLFLFFKNLLTNYNSFDIILSEGEGSKEHTQNSVGVRARDKPKKSSLQNKKILDKTLNRSYNKYRKNEREVNKMARKIFFARDWDKVGKNYYEIYTTVCMGYTFTVGKGIERDPNFSIFYVTNDGQHDHYEILDIYITAGDTLEEMQKGVLALLKREMKRVIKRGLTTRVKSGMLTTDQIKGWLK